MENVYLSIAALIVIRILSRRLYLEIYRDRLFNTRGQWFDLTLDESSTLSFDSALYGEVEELLCKMLRFAHRITFGFALLQRLQGCKPDTSTRDRMDSLIDALPDDYTRDKARSVWNSNLRSLHKYFASASMIYMLWTWTMFLRTSVRVRRIRGAREELVKSRHPFLERVERYVPA